MTTLPKTICGSLLAAVLATAVLIGCETENGRLGPEQRAIRLETEGCGHASPSHGSGVLIGGDQVATVAHLVAGSSAVTVVADGTHHEARITAYDRQRDLALLSVPGLEAEAVELGALEAGQSGRIVGGATSGTVPFVVDRLVQIDIDDVRETSRSVRAGYAVAARTRAGDSGAGAFDGDGQLIGIVFGVSSDDPDRTWITAASELKDFLEDATVQGQFSCDREQSKLVPQEATGQ